MALVPPLTPGEVARFAPCDTQVLVDRATGLHCDICMCNRLALLPGLSTRHAFMVARRATPSSHGGRRWLGAAPHTQEEPLSQWACSRWLVCPL